MCTWKKNRRKFSDAFFHREKKEKCELPLLRKILFFLHAWYLGQSTYLPPTSKLIADVNVDYAYTSVRLNQPVRLLTWTYAYIHVLRYRILLIICVSCIRRSKNFCSIFPVSSFFIIFLCLTMWRLAVI